MSIRIMSEVWERALSIKGTELLVLLALANSASNDGFVGVNTKGLARRTRVKEDQIQPLIDKLKKKGFLVEVSEKEFGLYTPKARMYRIEMPTKENNREI